MVVNNASNKRKAEDYPEGEESRISEVSEVIEEEEVKQCVCEIEQRVEHEDVKDEVHVEEEECWQHENELDPREVSNARKEEIGYMQSRTIWSVKPICECCRKPAKHLFQLDGLMFRELRELRAG
jgi:hypothetical protein